jgi:hypothetical protein
MANESILRYFILWYCAIKGLDSLLTGLGYAILTRDFPVFSLSPTVFRVKCLLQDCGRKPENVQRCSGSRQPALRDDDVIFRYHTLCAVWRYRASGSLQS